MSRKRLLCGRAPTSEMDSEPASPYVDITETKMACRRTLSSARTDPHMASSDDAYARSLGKKLVTRVKNGIRWKEKAEELERRFAELLPCVTTALREGAADDVLTASDILVADEVATLLYLATNRPCVSRGTGWG
jgi:hypothetical protein